MSSDIDKNIMQLCREHRLIEEEANSLRNDIERLESDLAMIEERMDEINDKLSDYEEQGYSI